LRDDEKLDNRNDDPWLLSKDGELRKPSGQAFIFQRAPVVFLDNSSEPDLLRYLDLFGVCADLCCHYSLVESCSQKELADNA
jgi:hypothetical protein